METTDDAVARALSFADRLRSNTELDTPGADVEGYAAVTIAMSNIAIARAIQELADAVSAPRD